MYDRNLTVPFPLFPLDLFPPLLSLFDSFRLQRTESLTEDIIIETSKNDKKMEHEVIKFILVKECGNAYIDKSITYPLPILSIIFPTAPAVKVTHIPLKGKYRFSFGSL